MSVLVIIVHIIVCLALIMIVLLQTGKGADMGAVFGGASSQTLFGSTGATTFLGKLTTGAAIIFMLTSLTLAYMSKSTEKSVVSDVKTTAPLPVESMPTPVVPAPDEQPSAPPAASETAQPAAPDMIQEAPGIPPAAAAPDAGTDVQADVNTPDEAGSPQ